MVRPSGLTRPGWFLDPSETVVMNTHSSPYHSYRHQVSPFLVSCDASTGLLRREQAGPSVVDPFRLEKGPISAFAHAFLATTFFRCWHLVFLVAAWAVR